MKSDLQQQITRLAMKVDTGFREVRQDIQALQEDLKTTIKMTGRHERKLARM